MEKLQRNKKKTWNSWKQEHDRVIVEQISANPDNVSGALRTASKELGRSFRSTCSRWYKIRHDNGNKAFAIKGKKNIPPNVKIKTTVIAVNPNADAWDIAKFAISRLSKSQKAELVKELVNNVLTESVK